MTLALALADSGLRVSAASTAARAAPGPTTRAPWRSRTAAGNCSNACNAWNAPPARRSRKSTSRSAAASAARLIKRRRLRHAGARLRHALPRPGCRARCAHRQRATGSTSAGRDDRHRWRRRTVTVTQQGARGASRPGSSSTPKARRRRPRRQVRDYGQHAVIAEVRPATPHGNRAWERFTPDGPLALLPHRPGLLGGIHRPARESRTARELDDDDEFLAALRDAIRHASRFRRTGPRASFPLALRVRRRSTQTTPGLDRQQPRRRCTRSPARASTSACATPGNWPKSCSNSTDDAGHGARWPPTRAAARLTGAAAWPSPTASSACSPTTCRRSRLRARPRLLALDLGARRCATSSPSA
jgi:hypothetical protein